MPGLPGPFEIVARRRPFHLVAPRFEAFHAEGPDAWAMPQPAPYVAITAELVGDTAVLALESSGARLECRLHDGLFGLHVEAAGRRTHHHSRRFGRLEPSAPPREIALSLTGTQLTGFTRERGRWVARSRYDLRERLATREPSFLAGLTAAAGGAVGRVVAGAFGQVGLRDVRLVTEADGTPVREGRRLLLSATHAGPGFFDAAHTGVWTIDPDGWEPTHVADLFFRRPDRTGVYGDHATHLVRDGDRWLVATSTWGDFDKARRGASVAVTLAETTSDLLSGRHVLDTRWLGLPTEGLRSVGVWDPHLVRWDGEWHVGYVSASRFFRFHPVLATGPDLDRLILVGADPGRTATEGTTLVDCGGRRVVLASDGRQGPRGRRRGFPVFDLSLKEIDRLWAPYPTNIPWPTLVETDDGWAMVTFDGTPSTGGLVGYGTHGDLVVATTGRPGEAG